MKFTYIALIAVALSVFGCAKSGLENIPLEHSFEPADKILQEFSDKIKSAPTGWEFTLTGPEKGFYAGFIHFNDKEARFLIDAGLEEPGLPKVTSFDCIVDHSNPTLALKGGAYSDFIQGRDQMDSLYSVLTIKQDTIYLRGQHYGNLLRLSKLPEGRSNLYKEIGLKKTIDNLNKLYHLPYYFKTLIVNGASYDLNFQPLEQKLYIHYGGKEQYKLHETLYSRTATGVVFKTPLVDGANVLYGIDEFTVAENGALQASVGGKVVSFVNEITPSTYDTNAAKEFINHPFHLLSESNEPQTSRYGFSISQYGFTVAGKVDGLGFSRIPDYQFLAFFHRLPTLDYGSCRFVIGKESSIAPYGPAIVPQLSGTGGYVRFNLVGQYGTPPSNIAAIVDNFTSFFTNIGGFWVIKSANAGYDLVSTDVAGGQRWIHFE